jgi:hypothetical protein
MFTCDNPTCTGHLGKFRDCVSEALYSMEADRTTGSVEFRGHLSLFRFEKPYSYGPTLEQDSALTVEIPAGTYLVLEDDQGFVKSRFWAEVDGVTDDEPNEVFERVDAEYSAWCDSAE